MSFSRPFLLLAAGLVSCATAAAAEVTAAFPAEKIRKALDKVHDIDIKTQGLDTFVNDLRQQTGINFVIDQVAVPAGAAVAPGTTAYAHIQVGGEVHGKSIRSALHELLRGQNLALAVAGDTVFITTTERAAVRQFTQPVRVNLDGVPLKSAVRQLARMSGVNIVLDPRQAKAAEAVVTANLEDVPLDSALTVLSDQADLAVARTGNILYITTPDRVEKLHKAATLVPPPPAPQYPAGLPVAGFGGLLGIGGVAPPAGGALGALGVGGGVAGLGGLGGLGGPVKLVPLPPPLPPKKEATKPGTEPPPPPPPGPPGAETQPPKDTSFAPPPADRPRPSRPGRGRSR
jgi:hypothetical protein